MQEQAESPGHDDRILPAVSVGVDIGGTKISAGLVTAGGRIVDRAEVPTPLQPGEPLVRAVEDVLSRLGTVPRDCEIGVAVAGRVDPSRRSVLQSANLGMRDVPLAEWLEARLNRSCVLSNDADAALWAEKQFGAARGNAEVVMVTVGTGVGGSAIVDGKLLTGSSGAASEPGHMMVKLGGRLCGCGGRGCLDQYGRGRALARYARRRHRESELTHPFSRQLGAGAAAGHPYALRAFEDLAYWLGVGIANIVMLLDPAQVILAGGVASAGAILADPVRAQLYRELQRRGVENRPIVATAALGEDAGVIGAAVMPQTLYSRYREDSRHGEETDYAQL